MNKDKDNELIALKVDIATAKAQMSSLVQEKINTDLAAKKSL